MNSVLATAWPRAGLLGNPSDLYGGCGIGFTFENFAAEVEFRPRRAANWAQTMQMAAVPELAMLDEMPGPEPRILRATRAYLAELGISQDQQTEFALGLRSDIPQQVGLSGSSAIVIAALRAIALGLSLSLDSSQLAEAALRVETEFMGIAAGPMDRLIQAHEGLIWMDFASGAVEALDPAGLPPLAILIDRNPGQDSGGVHAPVRARWEAGDPKVRATMAAFRPLVAEGLAHLRSGDWTGLKSCVDRNFALRAQVFPIGRRDRAVIERARSYGAAAKFCGSGGAILAVHEEPAILDELCLAVVGDGFQGLRPQVSGVAV